MASAADLLFVIDNIESDYTDHGWTSDGIGVRLDAGTSPTRVVATYWRKRATESIELVNVSESGSSRSLDSIYARMNALAESWEAKADLIDNPIVVSTAARISTFGIKRV